jgi:homocysteine S-methyltransferase
MLQSVHESFLNVGAQAITTNSYGVVPGVGFSEQERSQYITVAGKIARQAVSQSSKQGLVLGSLGPLVESYRADRIKKHEEGVADYTIACRALAPYVDAFLAETMSCVEEAAQALEAISKLESQKPLLVSFTLDSKGRFRNDQLVTEGVQQLLRIAKDKKVERKSNKQEDAFCGCVQ